MEDMDPAVWVALIGTVFGGVGLKLVENWLGRTRVKVDDAARIRDELRLEITAQREEIKQLEADAGKWQREYYDLRDKYITLQTEMQLALQGIKKEATHAEEVAEHITHDLPPTLP